jgi:transposase
LKILLPVGRVSTRPAGRKAELLKVPHPAYTAEFKEAAVQRVKDGQGLGAVARELGMSTQTLRNWLKAFEAGKLNGPGAKAVTAERMELSRLRAENKRLQMELEIAKKAAVFRLFRADVEQEPRHLRAVLLGWPRQRAGLRRRRAVRLAGLSGDGRIPARRGVFQNIPGIWQFSVFVDTGWVQQYKNTFVPEPNTGQLSSAGFGLQWDGPYQLLLSASVAFPLGRPPEILSANANTFVHCWVQLRKAF